MSNFYLFSDYFLIFCVMILAGALVVQTLGVVYGFRRLKTRGKPLLENLMEVAVLLHLLTMSQLLAEVIYHAKSGFVYSSGRMIWRYGLFLLMAGMSVMLSWQKRMFWPFTASLAAALVLPAAEKLSGRAFPVLFLGTMGFWLFRCIHILFLRRREHQQELSSESVKEAVDTMDSGLLFYQESGQILLQNNRMQELMLTLTGNFQRHGGNFYQALSDGKVLPSCRKAEMSEQLAYCLPDGSVWVFDRYQLRAGRQKCVLLAASNTTERWNATHQLWKQNQELEERNRELEQMLRDLDQICKTEETIRAKSRVHDVLGQRISLLLRAMREHREPDEVLLASFAEGLPSELTDVSEKNSHSLDTLTEVFRGLGVAVRVNGNLPEEETLARTFSEIAAEAVTNSVRHGYASEVLIRIAKTGRRWRMDITDSGIPTAGPVTEGGGLRGMRRKTEQLGGTFAYTAAPHFHITVEIPEGGAI